MSVVRNLNCLCKREKQNPIIRLKEPLKETSQINYKVRDITYETFSIHANALWYIYIKAVLYIEYFPYFCMRQILNYRAFWNEFYFP